MLHNRALATIVLASLAAGCAVGPDYVRPDPPLPQQYLGQAAVEQRHAVASADLVAWWSGFGDPQLARYVTIALDQNLDLAQAFARVAQARAGLGAANAALLPSGNVSAQAAKAYQSVETPLGQVLNSRPGFDRNGNAYEANLGATWEVDLFGGLRRGREAALAEYQASEAGAAATRLEVAAQTADIYISVRGLQTRLEVAQRQVRTQEELLSTVNLLYSKGLAAELQVRQVEGALAQVRASVPILETGLDAAMNALDVMLGSSPGTHRSELVEVRSIPVAPQISGAGSPGDLLRRASQAAGVLGLRWRLFDFGRIDAQIELAKGRDAELLAGYRLAVLHASEDVENAFSALVKREEQANVLAQGVDSLGRARGASFAAYQKGIVSLIEVLQADDNLLRASDARAQAQTESARAAVAAFRALGGGWQPYRSDAVAITSQPADHGGFAR